MPQFSIIIPVFNRPEEVRELLESLVLQSFQDFEVIIVEDGSDQPCKEIVKAYESQLKINYYFKENSGPGKSRNYGIERASSDFFIFFDSDCIIPGDYFFNLNKTFQSTEIEAYGGPDRAHPDFTDIQKAINYAMTSFFTTGGIRGSKSGLEKFHARSFNMGFSRKVYKATGGYGEMRFGEDIDLSIRIKKAGFETELIPEVFVFHKRRTDFRKFFKQVFNSGIARINLFILHPGSLKLVHSLPAFFTAYVILALVLSLLMRHSIPLFPLFVFTFVVFFDAMIKTKSIYVGRLSIVASFIQLTGYGLGFILAFWKRIILGQAIFSKFNKGFYK